MSATSGRNDCKMGSDDNILGDGRGNMRTAQLELTTDRFHTCLVFIFVISNESHGSVHHLRVIWREGGGCIN